MSARTGGAKRARRGGGPGGARIAWLPVLAVAFLLVFGFYPLPWRVPGHPALWAEHARFWAGASLLTLGPVLALAAVDLPWLHAAPSWLLRALRRPPPLAFAAVVVVVFTGLAVWVSWYVSGFAPVTGGEVAQVFHARLLAQGHVALPADPHWEFFAVDSVIPRRGWFSPSPLGGPAVLALGFLIRAPWLLYPLLGGVTAAALYQFARRACGEAQGRVAAVLFSVTAMPLLVAAGYTNHVPTLLLSVTALMLVAEWERAERVGIRRWCAAGIGLAIGATIAVRPLDGLVVAGAIGVFQLVVATGDEQSRWKELGAEVAGGVVGLAPLLLLGWGGPGGAWHFAYGAPWGAAHSPGFPFGVADTLAAPLRADLHAAQLVSALNFQVAGWALPALLVAGLGILAMRRTSPWDALLFGLFGALVLACGVYTPAAGMADARLLYTALPALLVVLARTPFLVAERWGGYWRHGAPLAALALVGVAWLVPMPPYGALGLVQAARASGAPARLGLSAAVREAGVKHAVVFIHQPFSMRLQRRLWGLGFSRSEAESLLRHSDACSLLDAVTLGEADSLLVPSAIAAHAATYAPGALPIRAADPEIRISSPASLTPACRAALALDAQYGSMPFAAGLVQETVGPDGRPGGDIVYVADLGTHNAALRARFGDRAWYRAWTERRPDGSVVARVAPY
ncbi:MAG TPA: glycosyltransferase family 39 protein [Gemmatimonadaceae bacterium]|jgi:hypothetical protein|nr:glycosyltransferase family 39 protein [Gemmatimonadaceae bacterium]